MTIPHTQPAGCDLDSLFTPGPWHLDAEEDSHVVSEDYHVIRAGCGFLAEGKDERELGFRIAGHMTKADALLIASAPELLRSLREVVDLAWIEDSHSVSFDASVTFGPHYDLTGLNGQSRQEFYGKYECIVWPGPKWSAYCTYDGSLWFEKFDSANDAKEACMRLLDRVLPDHPAMKARAVIAKAAGNSSAVARAAQAPQGDTRQGAHTENTVHEYTEAVAHEAWNVVCRNHRGLSDNAQSAIRDALLAPFYSNPPAAHTCTPADERAKSAVAALPEAWEKLADGFAAQGGAIDIAEAASMRNDAKELREAIAKDTRAAQGAGTAPVGYMRVLENGTKMGISFDKVDEPLIEGWKQVPVFDHPAPVSTAAAPVATSPAVDAPEGWMLVPIKPTSPMWKAGAEKVQGNDNPYQVYSAMLGAAPTATVSKAAANQRVRDYEAGVQQGVAEERAARFAHECAQLASNPDPQQRVRFEAAHPNLPHDKIEGDYVSSDTRDAWDTWKLALDSAAAAPDKTCQRCSGHEVIYVDNTQQPCPTCQDLSDYDEISPTDTGSGAESTAAAPNQGGKA